LLSAKGRNQERADTLRCTLRQALGWGGARNRSGFGRKAAGSLPKKGPVVANRASKFWERMPERRFSYVTTLSSSQVRNEP